MISENWWRSTSNDLFHTHFCGYCVSCDSLKCVGIWNFSGPYFLGLSREKYFATFRVQSKCEKIRIRKTPHIDTFHAVCVSTSASVPYSIPVYIVTTLKSYIEKTANNGSDDRQSVWEYFSTIIWVDSTWFSKIAVEEEGCKIPTLPLLLFVTPLNNYSTKT